MSLEMVANFIKQNLIGVKFTQSWPKNSKNFRIVLIYSLGFCVYWFISNFCILYVKKFLKKHYEWIDAATWGKKLGADLSNYFKKKKNITMQSFSIHNQRS